ncbi:MAG: hypothetical protein QM741_00830 [Rudaea sp.]|uniref:hypothetical protein n=1 Tax=Rudaea sp. TaxID=2136325 RepID=UPI0039E453AC
MVKMAEFQIGDRLAPNDKRVIGLRKEVEKMAPTALRRRFLDVYGGKFCLESAPKIASTLKAPSKPHRSQDQEQEKRKEESPDGDSSTSSGKPSPADDCPHQAIIDLYHEALPALRRVRDWTAARQKLLRARWREKAEHRSLDWWRNFFGYVAASDFLTGRTQNRGGRSWECDLEWLLRPANFVKVIEGKYENSESVEAARA